MEEVGMGWGRGRTRQRTGRDGLGSSRGEGLCILDLIN